MMMWLSVVLLVLSSGNGDDVTNGGTDAHFW